MDTIKYTVVGIAPDFIQQALRKLKQTYNLPVDETGIENHTDTCTLF